MVKYKYDVWGNHAILDANGDDLTSGVGILNPFRYRGYYYDTETDLYYLQTRYYDPEVGRFLSQDDVSYLAPDNINGLNLYAYCSNNPVMNVDPTGTSFWENFWKVVAGVVIIGGLVVGSIFTGGMLSIVLTGAAMGAIFGGLGSVVSTLITGDWDNFGNTFLIGTIAGGISGAFGATGFNVGWQIGINAVIGVGNYSLTTIMNGDSITIGGLVSSAIFGAVAGAVGGNGLMKGNQLTDAFIAFNGKNFFSTMSANLSRFIRPFIKQIFSYLIIGGLFNGLYAQLVQKNFNPDGDFFGF